MCRYSIRLNEITGVRIYPQTNTERDLFYNVCRHTVSVGLYYGGVRGKDIGGYEHNSR